MVASVGRIFLGVDLDVATRAVVAAQLDGVDVPGKPVPAENWHLTLRYLGDVDEVRFEQLLAEIDGTDLGRRFRIELTGLGAFPNGRRATVLWRGVEGRHDRLHDLAAAVEMSCEAVGLPGEDRPFRPHLTLARIRPARDVRDLVERTPLDPVAMEVTHVTAFRSHLGGPHARYEVVETLELG